MSPLASPGVQPRVKPGGQGRGRRSIPARVSGESQMGEISVSGLTRKRGAAVTGLRTFDPVLSSLLCRGSRLDGIVTAKWVQSANATELAPRKCGALGGASPGCWPRGADGHVRGSSTRPRRNAADLTVRAPRLVGHLALPITWGCTGRSLATTFPFARTSVPRHAPRKWKRLRDPMPPPRRGFIPTRLSMNLGTVERGSCRAAVPSSFIRLAGRLALPDSLSSEMVQGLMGLSTPPLSPARAPSRSPSSCPPGVRARATRPDGTSPPRLTR